MLNSNEPIKVAYLQKLANQWILNDALVTEMANNCFSDSMKNKLWSFEKVRNVLIEKKKRYEQQKIYFYYISLNILVIQKCKRTAKLSMFRLDFWKKGVCSKFATKTLYWDRFWVRECIFKLLWELQVTRDWLCKRDIAETSLKRLLLLIIFKSSHRSCSVEKGVFKNFTGKH